MDPQTSLLRKIDASMRATAHLTGLDRLSIPVREAMADVPRAAFVPADQISRAYDNTALPIGHGQTISQPFIVALMTELLDPRPNDIVLEVGTGSGYQAAILSHLVQRVLSVEIEPALAAEAAERLARLTIHNVVVRAGDGYRGWPEHAPYDGIIVTAACDEIPAPLVEQLAAGGRMVIPVGAAHHTEDLVLLEKRYDGTIEQRSVLPVVFVPLTGSHRAR